MCGVDVGNTLLVWLPFRALACVNTHTISLVDCLWVINFIHPVSIVQLFPNGKWASCTSAPYPFRTSGSKDQLLRNTCELEYFGVRCISLFERANIHHTLNERVKHVGATAHTHTDTNTYRQSSILQANKTRYTTALPPPPPPPHIGLAPSNSDAMMFNYSVDYLAMPLTDRSSRPMRENVFPGFTARTCV